MSLEGESANNGASRTYKVVAFNDAGDSPDSDTDTGYRGVGSLSYQWQRSSGDSDADYSNIAGATTENYDDTDSPAPTITPGTADASDGTSTSHVTLTLSGETGNDGVGRYFQCVLNAEGAAEQTSAPNRGYRGTDTLSRQWRYSEDGITYYDLVGATSTPWNDTTAPAPTITGGTSAATDGTYTTKVVLSLNGEAANVGDTWYYLCKVSMLGAATQDSSSDTGYKGVGSLNYQWYYSTNDIDYNVLTGATSDPWDDTTAPKPTIDAGTASASDGTEPYHVVISLSGHSVSNGDTWYYKCYLTTTGATPQYSTTNTGYKGTDTLGLQGQRSAADSDADYSNITGATSTPYNDTGGVHGPDGRYYQWEVNMTGADTQTSTSDRGYKTKVTSPTVTS